MQIRLSREDPGPSACIGRLRSCGMHLTRAPSARTQRKRRRKGSSAERGGGACRGWWPLRSALWDTRQDLPTESEQLGLQSPSSLFKSCFSIFELAAPHSSCLTIPWGQGTLGVPVWGDGVQGRHALVEVGLGDRLTLCDILVPSPSQVFRDWRSISRSFLVNTAFSHKCHHFLFHVCKADT